MPNNTAVREKLKTYLEEFKKNATAGAHYDTFLHALNDLVEKTDALYQRDDQGQYIPMNAESYRGIMNAYKTALDTCGGFMEAEQNENMRVIPGKIRELLAQDVTTLSNLDANHPGSLPQAVAAARGQTVDISGQKTVSMGQALSSRIPLSISDGKGGTLEGFFTEESIYDPAENAKTLRDAVAKITKKYPQEAELFNSLLRESVSPEDALYYAWINDSKKTESIERFEKFLVARNPDLKDMVPISADAENALSEFSEMIDKAYTQTLIYNKCLGATEKTNIDKRNCAMSMMANLLGNPKLVAKSVPITVISGSETKTGIFMEKAKGVDLAHAPEDEPARGFDFNHFSYTEGLRSMAELQVLDYICLNCDRHEYNMLYQFDNRGKFAGVQGIDNDASFGIAVPENDKSVKFTVPVDHMILEVRCAGGKVTEVTPDDLEEINGTWEDDPEIADLRETNALLNVLKEHSAVTCVSESWDGENNWQYKTVTQFILNGGRLWYDYEQYDEGDQVTYCEAGYINDDVPGALYMVETEGGKYMDICPSDEYETFIADQWLRRTAGDYELYVESETDEEYGNATVTARRVNDVTGVCADVLYFTDSTTGLINGMEVTEYSSEDPAQAVSVTRSNIMYDEPRLMEERAAMAVLFPEDPCYLTVVVNPGQENEEEQSYQVDKSTLVEFEALEDFRLFYDVDCTEEMDWIDVGQNKLTVYVVPDTAE